MSEEEIISDPIENSENQDSTPQTSDENEAIQKPRWKKDTAAAFTGKLDEDRVKRFEYLLKQTEIFSHFVSHIDNSPQVQDANEKTGGRTHKNKKWSKIANLVVQKGVDGESKKVMKFHETPDYIKGGAMRDYQIRGLNWLISLYENGINGILADEMGLGKTLQTISILGYLKHYKKISGPHIIVVPKSTVKNWLNEFQRWCPSIRTVAIIGEKQVRKQLVQDVFLPGKWDVCVTSYEMVLLEKGAFRRFDWSYLVVDEAHRIKNEKTRLAELLRTLNSVNRLLLTGTPLQNNLHELWALLNFLLPDVFNSAGDFDSWFNTENCLGDTTLVERLHGVLKPFLLRRLKSEVEKDLLPKKEIKVYVGMSEMQREWYTKCLMKDIEIINGAGDIKKKKMDHIMQSLRQCCDHPYIFNGAEGNPPYITDQHLVDNSGKMVVLDKLLTKLKAEGSRVLIFCQFVDMLDILEDYCIWRKHKYSRLDGSTSYDDRARDIDEFNTPGSETFIYMISTRAGGLGINLATADTVIIYHSDWNPQVDLQAIDRVHRIGQTKQVRIFRLIAENTIEERIQEHADVKLHLDRMVIQKGKIVDGHKGLKPKDLLKIVRLAGDMTGRAITDDDIDKILARSEQKTDEMNKKLDELGESGLRNFKVDTENYSIFNFEGEDFREKRKRKEEEDGFLRLPERKSKKMKHAYEPPVPPNHPVLENYQFYPSRLHELLEKEAYFYRKSINYKYQISPYSTLSRNREDEKRREEQWKIDSAKPLTAKEENEKKFLLTQGFANWTKDDFNDFVTCIRRYKSNYHQHLSEYVSTKTPEEIAAYEKVFWERYKEIRSVNGAHTLQNLERYKPKSNEVKLEPVESDESVEFVGLVVQESMDWLFY